MTRPTAGDPAPDFSLEADDGSTIGLADLAGQRVVLYFYPKDDTPGCTTEACEFRDLRPRFDVAGARVLGVSPDEISSHERFRARYDLNFTLLSDPGHTAAEAYGVWVEKNRYGRTYMGVERSTFVIGPDGLLEQAMYGVKAPGHAASVLETIGQA
jgi:peroxiredoxin Q/BCP